MDSFLQMLEGIKTQPLEYLPKRSILVLHDYLDTYSDVRRQKGIAFTKSEYKFTKFTHWIQEKFSMKPAFPWSAIILLNSEDEREAMSLFFFSIKNLKMIRV